MDMNARKKALMARRQDLVGHLEGVERELDRTPPKSFEDFATERQGDEVLEALGQAELNEVRRIDAALRRIEAGTYGICMRCDSEISDARLDAVPDAALCKSCALQSTL